MALDAAARRRWFGAVFLFAALAMLTGGETVLKGRLGDVAFVAYWLVCFGFTSLSILVAFLDARAVRRRIQDEQRKLLQTTLKKIESEVNGASREADGSERPPNPRN